MKINVCMLLGNKYEPIMRIPPRIGITSYITNFGHNVTWILSSDKIKEVKEDSSNDVRVLVVPYILYFEGPLKAFNDVLYALRRILFVIKNFKNNKYNMIFVCDGRFDGLLALYIKRRYKIPFVFQMSNPIEQVWEIRKFYLKHKWFWYFIFKIKKSLTMHILHNADMVLTISKWLKEDLTKKKIEDSKIIPIPNGIDPDRFSDGNGNKIRKRYRLEDSKVIIYIGTLNKPRHLDVLIRAFSIIRAKKENVKLLIIGDGSARSILERLSHDLEIEGDVIFIGQVYFHEIPNFIAAADIGVSPVPPLDFYKLSSPIKMFEYMMMGKPVVANEEIPEQKKVIEESGGGVLVKFEDESFAKGIIEILDDSKKAKEIGRKGYDWVIKNRSYEKLAKRVEKAYHKLLKKQKVVNDG